MRIPFGKASALGGAAQAAPRPPRRSTGSGASLLLSLFFVLLALLMGAVVGLGSPVLVTMLAGAIFATLVFVLLDLQGLLLSLFVITFLVQGSALYFLGLRQATWVAVGMAMLFFIRVLLSVAFAPREPAAATAARRRAGAGMMLAVGAYAAAFVVSSVLNRPPATQMVAAVKGAWPMFGVLLAFVWLRWQPAQLARLWWLVLAIGMLQLPVVIYQHFFIANLRSGAYDSVVGTFGGTQLSGGLSSIMVLFIITVITYALASWNRGTMSRGRMLALCAVCLAVILLGEVKAAVAWIPVAALFVLRRRVMKNVSSLLLYLVMVSCLVAGVYGVYKTLYWGKSVDKAQTVSEKFDAGGGYFFDTRGVDYRNGEVSRGASLALWIDDRLGSVPKRLLGYGPGASKSSGAFGVGELVKRFSMLHIDATTLAVLLWDVGIVGALAYCAMIFVGIVKGWRFVAAGQGTPSQLVMVETCTAILLLFSTLLIYNRALMDEPTAQLLLMFCLGCVMQAVCYGADATPAAAAAAGAVARPAPGLRAVPAGRV